MPLLESAQVEAMVKLLSTAGDPTVEMPLADRKRQLLEGLGAIVSADVWIWMVSKINLDRRGDAMAISSIDGGWIDERERASLLCAMIHPELARSSPRHFMTR